MEAEENKSEKPKNATSYHCQICNIYCTSSVNLQTHLFGNKHKAVEKVLRTHGIVKPGSTAGMPVTAPESLPGCATTESKTNSGKTLEERLNSLTDRDSAIGLQYITEYQSQEDFIYECNLCGYQSNVVDMFMHVLSAKHRLAYLTKHYPDLAKIEGPNNRIINKQIKKISAAVELMEGRKKIMVSTTAPTLKATTDSEKTFEELLNSCRDVEPAIGLQYVTEYQSKDDFIYDCNLCEHQSKAVSMFMHVMSAKHKLAYLTKHYPDMADIEGPSNRSINKQLKKICAEVEQKEGRQKIMVSTAVPTLKDDSYSIQFSDSLVTWFAEDGAGTEKKKKENNAESEGSGKMANETNKSQPGNKEHENQNTEQLTNMELNDSDSEEFHNNEKLLRYLKTFEIVNQDDATFILNVTQKLTGSLVTYRQKVLERKNTSDLNVEKRCDRSEATALNVGNPNSGIYEKQPSVRYSCEDKGRESEVHPSKKRKVLPLSADDSAKNNKPGPFVHTFVDIPSEQFSPDVGTQDPPSSVEHILNPIQKKKSSPHSQADAPMTTSSESSISESGVIAEFFNSIRNMEVNEVAATLHRISALNPSFNGMNIENVLKILIKSGALKSKDSSSTS